MSLRANAFNVFFMMSLFIGVFSIQADWAEDLPDFVVKDIETFDDEVVVWFQNNGSVELGKKYKIKLVLNGEEYLSEELLMLGTHNLQGYSFPIHPKLKTKRLIAQAIIDPENKVNELSENNQFQKILLPN